MVYDYLITLKKPDFKVVDIFSRLLYLVAFSAFVFFSTKMETLLNPYSVSAVLLILVFIYISFKKPKNGTAYYTLGLALAALTFAIGPYSNWLLTAFFVVCIFSEREYKFKKEVGFTEQNVVFNTLIKKHYDWAEFNNLLIKDGIITFDFKNNKVIQKEIEGEVSPEIETEFNIFCRQQIAANPTLSLN